VHDVVLIEDLEGVDELLEDEKSLFFWNNPILPEHAFEGAAVAVLVDKVEVVGRFEHIDVLDDVFVFFDIGENINFVDCAFLEFLVLLETPHLDDFDCVLLVVVLVYGPVDLTVCSLSDYFVEGVVLNNADHAFISK